jgi:hypothetical protein
LSSPEGGPAVAVVVVVAVASALAVAHLFNRSEIGKPERKAPFSLSRGPKPFQNATLPTSKTKIKT